MSLLIRNLNKLNPVANIRSYSEVVNVFGRRTVDTTGDKPKTIAVVSEKEEHIKELTGHPEEHISGRTVKIYIPAKNCMQSGTYQIKKWKLEFDNRERWENPTMGWRSTGDPLSNLATEFGSKEDAIVYCERMGLKYRIEEPRYVNKRIKSYGANFSWDKNTRRTAK